MRQNIVRIFVIGLTVLVGIGIGYKLRDLPTHRVAVSLTPPTSTGSDSDITGLLTIKRSESLTPSSDCIVQPFTYDDEFKNIQNLNCYKVAGQAQLDEACGGNPQQDAIAALLNKTEQKEYNRFVLTANPEHWQNSQLAALNWCVSGIGGLAPIFVDTDHVLWYSGGCGGVGYDATDPHANEKNGAVDDCDRYQKLIEQFFKSQ